MSNGPPDFRVEPAKREDVQKCVDIITYAFSGFSVEQKLGNTGDEGGKKAAAQRHLRAWNEHLEDTGTWPPIRCVHRDPETGQEATIACAEWFLYPGPLPRDDQRGANYLLSATWLPDDESARLRQAFKPTLDLRTAWTKGRGYGLLTYMSTELEWRRKGAATACVQWGIDQCRELGIPAYLEASKEGAPVYEKLGFEIVDDASMELDGEKIMFPAMMWWPPGTKDGEKRKASTSPLLE